MLSKLRYKTNVESSDPGSNAAKAAQEGRFPAMVEQIENQMNFPVRQQGNSFNSPIEQVEGRGADKVNVSILFSIISNEFQALVQKIKSQGVII